MNADQVKQANKREVKRINDVLRSLPKVAALLTAGKSLKLVMQPNAKNYWFDRETMSKPAIEGNKVVHGSSNAAYNWRVGINGASEPYKNFKGRSPVGMPYDIRSEIPMTAEMQEVIAKRHSIDIARNLYNSLLSVKAMELPTPTVTLYNQIDGKYAENANLAAAAKAVTATYAAQGLRVAELHMKTIIDTKDVKMSQVRSIVKSTLGLGKD